MLAGSALCLSSTLWLRGDEGDDGWQSLFDGKTLDGWHVNKKRIGHGTGGRWAVEDGTITGTQNPPGNGGLLLSDETFGDFELRVAIKPDWGVDSGLFIRSTPRGQAIQVGVDHFKGGHVGQLYGEGLGGFNTRTFSIDPQTDDAGNIVALDARPRKLIATAGVDHSVDATTWAKTWRWAKWNELHVRVAGHLPRVTTWINDTMITDVDFQQFAHPRFDRDNVRDILSPRGRIAFQIHGGTKRWVQHAACRWRDVRLRRV